MHCPFCNAPDSKVIDSRLAAEGRQIRRRRECVACGDRFTTFESYDVVMPRVIKSNGRNEPFNDEKLRNSLTMALQKRPVSQDQIEATLLDIGQHLRRLGERDVTSRKIGEIVMQALYDLDHVAYVRFASVYRDFQDVDAFKREIEQMGIEQTGIARNVLEKTKLEKTNLEKISKDSQKP
jgi:transcriptional repressor NrdR